MRRYSIQELPDLEQIGPSLVFGDPVRFVLRDESAQEPQQHRDSVEVRVKLSVAQRLNEGSIVFVGNCEDGTPISGQFKAPPVPSGDNYATTA